MNTFCKNIFSFLFILCCFNVVSSNKENVEIVEITEDNWTVVLDGEWLVKFYAPWCPACQSLEETWRNVAKKMTFCKVATIDVTEHPGLSGRFLVTSLPTIYHIQNGEFRIYRGARSEEDISSFVLEQKWTEIAALSWLSMPTSPHMGALAFFFRASMMIRNLHNTMTELYGVPVWGSYLLFAVMTLAVGLVLGLLLVCLCDCLWPQKDPEQRYIEAHMYDDDKDDTESDIVDDREEKEKTVVQRKGKKGKAKQAAD